MKQYYNYQNKLNNNDNDNINSLKINYDLYLNKTSNKYNKFYNTTYQPNTNINDININKIHELKSNVNLWKTKLECNNVQMVKNELDFKNTFNSYNIKKNKNIKELNREIKLLNYNNSNLIDQNIDLKKINEKYQNNLNIYKTKYNEFCTIESKKYLYEIQKLKNDNYNLNNLLKESDLKVKDYHQKFTYETDRNIKNVKDLDNLNLKCIELKRYNNEIKNNLENKNITIHKLKESLSEFENINQIKTNEFNILLKKNSEFNKFIENSNEDIIKLKTTIEMLNQELDIAKNKIQNLENWNLQLKNDKSEISDHLKYEKNQKEKILHEYNQKEYLKNNNYKILEEIHKNTKEVFKSLKK